MASAMLGIGSSKVSRELQTALQDDVNRQAVDAAKKRAVGQHVDYDTFKNMVAVAHLRPLQEASLTETVSHAPAWRFAPDGLLAKPTESQPLRFVGFDPLKSPVPSTSDEFLRLWKRQCPTRADKLTLLSRCGPDHLCRLFKVNLPADLLSDILTTLYSPHIAASAPAGVQTKTSSCVHKKEDSQEQVEHSDSAAPSPMQTKIADECNDANFIFNMLQGLSGAGRFSLTVKLLTQTARQAASKLFTLLQQPESSHSDTLSYSPEQLHRLQTVYGIK